MVPTETADKAKELTLAKSVQKLAEKLKENAKNQRSTKNKINFFSVATNSTVAAGFIRPTTHIKEDSFIPEGHAKKVPVTKLRKSRNLTRITRNFRLDFRNLEKCVLLIIIKKKDS